MTRPSRSRLRSLEHARTCELLVAGHRLMEAAEDVATFARAYRAAEDALVAVRVACVVTKKTNARACSTTRTTLTQAR